MLNGPWCASVATSFARLNVRSYQFAQSWAEAVKAVFRCTSCAFSRSTRPSISVRCSTIGVWLSPSDTTGRRAARSRAHARFQPVAVRACTVSRALCILLQPRAGGLCVVWGDQPEHGNPARSQSRFEASAELYSRPRVCGAVSQDNVRSEEGGFREALFVALGAVDPETNRDGAVSV